VGSPLLSLDGQMTLSSTGAFFIRQRNLNAGWGGRPSTNAGTSSFLSSRTPTPPMLWSNVMETPLYESEALNPSCLWLLWESPFRFGGQAVRSGVPFPSVLLACVNPHCLQARPFPLCPLGIECFFDAAGYVFEFRASTGYTVPRHPLSCPLGGVVHFSSRARRASCPDRTCPLNL